MLAATSLLEQIPVTEQLSSEDWTWLERSGEHCTPVAMYTRLQIEHWHKTGEVQVFRVKPSRGIYMTELLTGPTGHRRLCILRFAGENIAQLIGKCIDELQHYARQLGCQQIETMIFNPKLYRVIAPRLGLKVEAVQVVKEV